MFKYFLFKYLIGYSFISIFWYEFIWIFVRIIFLIWIYSDIRSYQNHTLCYRVWHIFEYSYHFQYEHSLVSYLYCFFLYEYNRIFVRIVFLIHVYSDIHSECHTLLWWLDLVLRRGRKAHLGPGPKILGKRKDLLAKYNFNKSLKYIWNRAKSDLPSLANWADERVEDKQKWGSTERSSHCRANFPSGSDSSAQGRQNLCPPRQGLRKSRKIQTIFNPWQKIYVRQKCEEFKGWKVKTNLMTSSLSPSFKLSSKEKKGRFPIHCYANICCANICCATIFCANNCCENNSLLTKKVTW